MIAGLARLPSAVAIAASRHAGWVLLAWLLLASSAVRVAFETLSINTDTGDLVSDELPFKRSAEAVRERFPQLSSLLVLVVGGEVPEEVDLAAQRLARALEADEARFQSVFVPGMDPFFDRNGLLYLDVDELDALATRLAGLQPFIARLAEEPALEGLLDSLSLALEEEETESLDAFSAPVARIAATLDAVMAGTPSTLSWQRILEEDESGPARRVIMVRARADYEDFLPYGEGIERVRETGRAVGIGPESGLTLGVTGQNAIEHEDLLSVSRGAALASVLALALVIVTLLLGLRSGRVVGAAIVTLLAGLAVTAGGAAILVGHLNLISIAFAVLYIGLGIDAAIHFSMRFVEQTRAGIARPEALKTTARDVAPALTLCAVTTAAGFFAFIPTAYKGVGELGLIGGTGMFVSLLAALTLLPALLRVAGPRALEADGVRQAPPEPPPRTWRRPRRLVAAGVITTVLTAAVALGVRFDYDPINLSDPDNESVRTYRQLAAITGDQPLNASALARGPEEASSLAKALEALPEVASVTSLHDFVPGGQDEKLVIVEEMALLLGFLPQGAEPRPATSAAPVVDAIARYREALARLPGEPSPALATLAASLTRLDQRIAAGPAPEVLGLVDRTNASLFATLPRLLERLDTSLQAGPVERADVPAAIASRWVGRGDAWRLEIAPATDLSARGELQRFVEAVTAVAPEATDDPVEILRVGQAIVTSFAEALLMALAAIAVLLWLSLRSLRDALTVLVPLLYGALVLNAVMAVTDIRYNFANLIALPLLLGIAVDNGVHVVKRMRDGTVTSTRALLRSSTARAIVVSSLTTVVSFGCLGLSAHPGTASMGWILTIGMTVLVIATLALLPPILARRGPAPQR